MVMNRRSFSAAMAAGAIDAAPSMAALPPGLSFQKPSIHSGEPLRLEIESFLECVRTRRQPRVSGSDGLRALALALQFNQAIAAHAQHTGLDRLAR